MIDGIKFSCTESLANSWRSNPLLDFGLRVSETTGEAYRNSRRAKFRSLTFAVSDGLVCSVSGSIHKYYNGNDTNCSDFTFGNLCESLYSLSALFGIDLKKTEIYSIEAGVNLQPDYAPSKIIKNAVCHKASPFERLSGLGRLRGCICEHTDYSLKLYDKGYQSCAAKGAGYLFRCEIKLHRSRMFAPFGVSSLYDLLDSEKVALLFDMLIEALRETVFFDFGFKKYGLSKKKLLLWERYGNPNFWANMDKRQRYKARAQYASLCVKYGCFDWRQFCIDSVLKKGRQLMEASEERGDLFHDFLRHEKGDLFHVFQKGKRATFSKLEYVLEKVAFRHPLERGGKATEKRLENVSHFCIICGRVLTGQKKNSRFCSERIYGKSARVCRNRDSNRRLTLKRKIKKAMAKNMMLQITYSHNGSSYTDILSSEEMLLTREWLDKITSVTVLHETQPEENFCGDAAKCFLSEIANSVESGTC